MLEEIQFKDSFFSIRGLTVGKEIGVVAGFLVKLHILLFPMLNVVFRVFLFHAVLVDVLRIRALIGIRAGAIRAIEFAIGAFYHGVALC